MTASDEIIDFIVAGKSPEESEAFRPSEGTQAHIARLLDLARTGSLSEADRAELDDFLQLEHLMVMAKARACRQPMR